MKRLTIIIIIFFLSLAFTGCGQDEINSVSGEAQNVQEQQPTPAGHRVPDTLYFTSLTEFLEGTRITKAGRAAGEFAELAESVNLLGLEEFYLPIGIPETYRLFRISVNEMAVALWYLPEEHLVSKDTARYADFTRPLTEVSRMPFRDATLYARWQGDE